MTEAKKPPDDSAKAKTDAMSLAEEAEAEAAEAEALAAAARARARAARLRREAHALAQAAQQTAGRPTEEGFVTAGDAHRDAEAAVDAEAAAEAAEAEAQAAGDSEAEPFEVTDEDPDEVTEEASAEAIEEATEEPAEPEPTTASGWRRWVRSPSMSTIGRLAAILIILGFVALSGLMGWHHHQATQRQQRAAAFAAGATVGVINMTSLDFNKAKEDVQRVIDSSTGEFRDDFQQRANDFTTVVQQSKVVTEGTVTAAAVESMDDHSAVVLVSATSRITNSAGAKDEPRAWRLRVTVTEEGGQYKMSKVEFVP